MGGLGDNGNSQGPFLTLKFCVFSSLRKKKRYRGMCHRRRRRTETFFFLQLLGIRGDLLLLFFHYRERRCGELISFPFTAVCLSQSFFLYTDGMKPDRTRSSSFQFRIEEKYILNRKLPSEYRYPFLIKRRKPKKRE